MILTGLSIFIWWKAGHDEQKAEQAARAERGRFVADWNYFQQRAEDQTAS